MGTPVSKTNGLYTGFCAGALFPAQKCPNVRERLFQACRQILGRDPEQSRVETRPS